MGGYWSLQTNKVDSEPEIAQEEILPVENEEAASLKDFEPQVEEEPPGKLRQICIFPPQGIFAEIVTNVAAAALIWAVFWAVIGKECLPGGNVFGLLFLFFCSLLGGKIMESIRIPGFPPLPRLFGMLLAGFLIRNVPYTSKLVQINVKWGATMRNIALSIILALAGLGLDPQVKYQMVLNSCKIFMDTEMCGKELSWRPHKSKIKECCPQKD
uniref:Solute carrier family 9 member B1 n=1 Tax=Podarcis muralis TaxID=64176 RepID=A0A670IVA4_PODMU